MGYWVTEGDFHCVMYVQHTSNIMCCSQLDFIPAIQSGRTFSTKKNPHTFFYTEVPPILICGVLASSSALLMAFSQCSCSSSMEHYMTVLGGT